jgi:uncharacterized membrane protein (DUF485 family)
MSHGPATEWQPDKTQDYKAKLGLIMFAVYTAAYFAFVLLCVFYPKFMAVDIGSLNVAIVYGFGIIVLAMIQAVIYNNMCSKKEHEEDQKQNKK